MKISIGVYPNQNPAEIIASGKLADSLGFNTLWMLDSHLLFHEVYTIFGALSVSTSRIRLGTAVTNPLTRHVTVTASAFATLAALTGNRATLGISVGDSALRAMNLEIAKVSTLAEAVVRLRRLIAGESVEFAEGETARLHQAKGGVPIYVAATGPKMLKLAGETGDGVILMNGVAPELISEAISMVRAAESDAGRPRGACKVVVWAACHPSYDAVKYNVARAILRNIPGPIDELTQRVAAEVKKAYNYEEHGNSEAAFGRLIPDELVPRFAFSGSSDHIRSQIDALSKLDVDEVVLAVPFAKDITPRDEVLRELAPVLLGRNA